MLSPTGPGAWAGAALSGPSAPPLGTIGVCWGTIGAGCRVDWFFPARGPGGLEAAQPAIRTAERIIRHALVFIKSSLTSFRFSILDARRSGQRVSSIQYQISYASYRAWPGLSTSLPKGLIRTSNCGSKVNEANKATVIASTVNRPKYIVGMKFDRLRMENPMTSVTVV